MNHTNFSMITFMKTSLPKPKLKRSFNIAIATMTFTTNSGNPPPPPFEIKTKTIEDCAKLIVHKQLTHDTTCKKRLYNVNL